jgi:hypothetical protein
MTQASEEVPDTRTHYRESPGEIAVSRRPEALATSFFVRQLRAAGLAPVTETVVAGRDVELAEALAVCRASLPLLGKLIELRAGANAAGQAATPGPLPIERAASLPVQPRHIGQAMTDWESFCRRLIALRGEVSPGGPKVFWYPIVGEPLDRDGRCQGDSSGEEVLRGIALARLLLPAEFIVQAPLAVLGPKLAQVALDFGASHLGYVAFDGQTPNHALVADPSLLDELLGSCLPTSLKAESQPTPAP